MDRYRAAVSSAPPRSFLLVNFPVAPQILPFAFGDEAASWGELVSVTCSVAKGDQPLEISWAFNGTPIGSHHGSDVVIGSTNKKNSVLTIESVAASHAGEYTCSASNRAGATTHSSRLTVNGTCVIPSHVKKKKKRKEKKENLLLPLSIPFSPSPPVVPYRICARMMKRMEALRTLLSPFSFLSFPRRSRSRATDPPVLFRRRSAQLGGDAVGFLHDRERRLPGQFDVDVRRHPRRLEQAGR